MNTAEIGHYGVMNAETAPVIWDDRKLADCGSNDDASWLAGLVEMHQAKKGNQWSFGMN
ncbi:MAG: hypothetical protein JF607_24510 [Burkholderiales bacterium]|jgi:hypothetical protein|nr:hypothetical protein [Burkholderiales bacterium]MBW8894549.1 hypothetical protein [Burkholderiales bacterium]